MSLLSKLRFLGPENIRSGKKPPRHGSPGDRTLDWFGLIRDLLSRVFSAFVQCWFFFFPMSLIMPKITNRRSCVSSSGFSLPCSLEFLHLDSQVFLACQSGKLYSLYFSRVHLPSLAISCLCLYGLEFSLSWKSCFSRTPCVFISFTYWNWCQTCVAWSTAAIKCKLPNKPVLLNVSLHCNSVIKNAQCLEKLESLNSSACYNSLWLNTAGAESNCFGVQSRAVQMPPRY